MPVEFFRETFLADIVFTGEAVDRHDITQVGVGQIVDMVVIIVGFAPAVFISVVAVLKKEGPGVERIGNHGRGSAGPASQFGWCGGYVTQPRRAENTEYGRCILSS